MDSTTVLAPNLGVASQLSEGHREWSATVLKASLEQ